MNTINCLIVDDEALARNLVANYIGRLPHLAVVGEAANPLEAMAVLQNEKVDLIFLDIQMPELTGIEFLNSLSQNPLVIFTTAYKDYALEGYDLDVVDYLLKPFRFERFLQAVNKASTILSKVDNTPIVAAEEPLPEKAKDYILIKADFKVYKVLHRDIKYIEGMKEYVAYHTNEGRKLSLESLKNLENKLSVAFMRVHKSFIVNLNHIKAIEGNMIHIDDQKIPIGSSYKEAFMNRL